VQFKESVSNHLVKMFVPDKNSHTTILPAEVLVALQLKNLMISRMSLAMKVVS
jgi:hypothetical protein